MSYVNTPIEILRDKWWIGVVSLVVSLVLTPLIRLLADRGGGVPSIRSDEYCTALPNYCREKRIDAVIPLLDPELKSFAEAKGRFAEAGAHLVISSPETVDVCVDKVRAARFLRDRGFLTPKILDKDTLGPGDLSRLRPPRRSARARRVTPYAATGRHGRPRPGCHGRSGPPRADTSAVSSTPPIPYTHVIVGGRNARPRQRRSPAAIPKLNRVDLWGTKVR